jgi:hypothetical protein
LRLLRWEDAIAVLTINNAARLTGSPRLASGAANMASPAAILAERSRL